MSKKTTELVQAILEEKSSKVKNILDETLKERIAERLENSDEFLGEEELEEDVIELSEEDIDDLSDEDIEILSQMVENGDIEIEEDEDDDDDEDYENLDEDEIDEADTGKKVDFDADWQAGKDAEKSLIKREKDRLAKRDADLHRAGKFTKAEKKGME